MRRREGFPAAPNSTPEGEPLAPADLDRFMERVREKLIPILVQQRLEQCQQLINSTEGARLRAQDMLRAIKRKPSGSMGPSRADQDNAKLLDTLIERSIKLEGELRRIRDGGTGEGVVKVYKDFRDWTEDAGRESWGYFKSAKEEEDSRLLAAEQDAKTRGRVADEIRKMKKSFELSDSDKEQGKDRTYAVLVEKSTGEIWTGVSGPHETLNTVMIALLARCTKEENWPLRACAEVEAMNNYLNDHAAIGNVELIKGKDLVFQSGATNRAGAKAACRNCSQWIANIGATRA